MPCSGSSSVDTVGVGDGTRHEKRFTKQFSVGGAPSEAPAPAPEPFRRGGSPRRASALSSDHLAWKARNWFVALCDTSGGP